MITRIELIGGAMLFSTAVFTVAYAHDGAIPVAALGLTLSYALNVCRPVAEMFPICSCPPP